MSNNFMFQKSVCVFVSYLNVYIFLNIQFIFTNLSHIDKSSIKIRNAFMFVFKFPQDIFKSIFKA